MDRVKPASSSNLFNQVPPPLSSSPDTRGCEAQIRAIGAQINAPRSCLYLTNIPRIPGGCEVMLTSSGIFDKVDRPLGP